MSTTSSVVGTMALVVAGRMADNKPVDVKIVVGGGVLAIALSLLGNANEELAGRFATVILIVALFTYGPKIAGSIGLIPKTDIPKWGR